MKKYLILIITVLLISGCTVSQKNNPKAFLNANYGMTTQEVEEALDMDLMTYDEYIEKYNSTDIFIVASGKLLNTDYSNKLTVYYLPRIKLYDTLTEIELTFFENQLSGVNMFFGVFADSDFLVKKISSDLDSKYDYVEKEESDFVEGAYHLYYEKKDVTVTLWVNTESEDNIVNLFMNYTLYKDEYNKKLENPF